MKVLPLIMALLFCVIGFAILQGVVDPSPKNIFFTVAMIASGVWGILACLEDS